MNNIENYQQIYIPCKENKNALNVLYIFDILSNKRYEKLGQQLSSKFNFYGVSAFFDHDYKLVLKKPSIERWAEYVYQYIRQNKLDISKTIVISQYYACSLIPLLNKKLNKKIKKAVYVSPFIKFSRGNKKMLVNILHKDESSIGTLYNDVDHLKNDVDWIQTSRLENIVSDANIKDLNKIVRYFNRPWNKLFIKRQQKRLNYFLGLFISEKDEIVNFNKCQKFFSKYNKMKLYPFFNSKLCSFEEENFKFEDCVINFSELG